MNKTCRLVPNLNGNKTKRKLPLGITCHLPRLQVDVVVFVIVVHNLKGPWFLYLVIIIIREGGECF